MSPAPITTGPENKRQEPRQSVESLSLPFVGSRVDDRQIFQYLLLDSSPHGAKIALPQWVQARERLQTNDLINLYAPFRIMDQSFGQGRLMWTRWEDELDAQTCGIKLEKASPLTYPVYIDLTSSSLEIDLQKFASKTGLLRQVIKDTYLLKKGILIYLEHLFPYLSRIGQLSKNEFKELQSYLLGDIQEKVTTHRDGLETLLSRIDTEKWGDDDVAAALDLEGLLKLVESELYMELFQTVFDHELAELQLRSIKILEDRLYYNYNTVVMLYLRSLNPN